MQVIPLKTAAIICNVAMLGLMGLHYSQYVLEIRIRNCNWLVIFKDWMCYYTAVPLKMYGKFGQAKQILVGQMLKLVGKWPMADCVISNTVQLALMFSYYDIL